jgi:integrase
MLGSQWFRVKRRRSGALPGPSLPLTVARLGGVDRDLVFCDEIGRRIYPSRLGERFVKARKAAGIPISSLHVPRHTSATLALTATSPVPLHVVAGRIGDDPKTVLATYAHLLPHSDAMAADAVAARSLTSR